MKKLYLAILVLAFAIGSDLKYISAAELGTEVIHEMTETEYATEIKIEDKQEMEQSNSLMPMEEPKQLSNNSINGKINDEAIDNTQNSLLDQASRASGLLNYADYLSIGAKFETVFKSVVTGSAGSSSQYDGYVGKALKFHTSRNNSFYRFTELNTFAYQVMFQIYEWNSAELNLIGAYQAVSENSYAEPVIKLEADQDYYIIAYTQNRNTKEIGNVSLTITEIYDDCPDSFEASNVITLGSTLSGALEGIGDKDFFKIETSAEKAFYVFSFASNTVDGLKAEIYNSNRELIYTSPIINAASSDKNILQLSKSSRYFVSIFSKSASKVGTYSVSVSKMEDDAGDTVHEAKDIHLEQNVVAGIQSNEDVDVFKFNSRKVNICNVSIANKHHSDALRYRIMTADGKSIQNGSIGAGLHFVVPMTKINRKTKYFIQISGHYDTPFEITVSYVKHPIKYKLNGGKNNLQNPDSFHESEELKLLSPGRKSYSFKGWYRDKALTRKISAIPNTEKEKITIFAKWQKVNVKNSKLISLKSKGKRKVLVYFAKVNGAKGYQIAYSTSKKFKKKQTVYSNVRNKVITNLSKGRKYYVRVRAYNNDSVKNKIYGKWSNIKSVNVK